MVCKTYKLLQHRDFLILFLTNRCREIITNSNFAVKNKLDSVIYRSAGKLRTERVYRDTIFSSYLGKTNLKSPSFVSIKFVHDYYRLSGHCFAKTGNPLTHANPNPTRVQVFGEETRKPILNMIF